MLFSPCFPEPVGHSTLDAEVQAARVQRQLPRPELARLIRRNAGVSLRTVAGELGVTAPAVSFWERGLRRPRAETAERYLKLLQQLATAE